MNALAAFVCAASVIWLSWLWIGPDNPQPHNMPTQADIKTYLLDCEQFNPGRQCIVVAMPVPDFSDRGSE